MIVEISKKYLFTCEVCEEVKEFEESASVIIPDKRRCDFCRAEKVESEAHRSNLPLEEFIDIEDYTLHCFENSKQGLPFNPRFLLSMIREIRILRSLVAEINMAISNSLPIKEEVFQKIFNIMTSWEALEEKKKDE